MEFNAKMRYYGMGKEGAGGGGGGEPSYTQCEMHFYTGIRFLLKSFLLRLSGREYSHRPLWEFSARCVISERGRDVMYGSSEVIFFFRRPFCSCCCGVRDTNVNI